MASQTEHKYVKGKVYDDKGTWVIRARVFNPATGKADHRSKSTGFKVKNNTKRKAEQAMRPILDEWEREANAKVINNDPLFSEYVQKWLDKKSLSVRKNTLLSYEQYADKHILPRLGNMKVREMSLKDLQDFHAEILRTLSVKSAKKFHIVISGALLDAVREGIIPVNFADYMEFPKAGKFEGKAYTEQQVAQLLEATAQEGEPIQAAVILGVCYGLRRSEICGMRWKDIDFDKLEMRVRNTVTQNGSLIIEAEATKTDKSNRRLTLIPYTIPYLEQLKAEHASKGFKLDKVCRWPDGGEVQPNYITHKFRSLLKKHGLDHIRVHDMRHTAASLLAIRVTPKQLQDFLGHKDISTTMNIYTHLSDEDRKLSSASMDEVLKKCIPCSERCSELA